jgi:hypothetical protein
VKRAENRLCGTTQLSGDRSRVHRFNSAFSRNRKGGV